MVYVMRFAFCYVCDFADPGKLDPFTRSGITEGPVLFPPPDGVADQFFVSFFFSNFSDELLLEPRFMTIEKSSEDISLYTALFTNLNPRTLYLGVVSAFSNSVEGPQANFSFITGKYTIV